MALSAGEQLSGGQVVNAQGRTVCISEAANAVLSAGEFYSGGYLRDADGRMVICQDTLNAALGAGEVYSGGDVRDSMGRVAVAVDTANAALSANEQISGGQVRDSLGRRVIAIDTLGAALSAGEFFSGGNVLDKVGRTVVALEIAPGSAYDNAVLTDGPVAFFKLNEPSGTTATDVIAGNNGTYTGGCTLAQPGPCSDGETGVALDGSSGYINVPDAAPLRILGTMTLEMWVKPTDRANFNELITKGVTSAAAPWEWRTEQSSGAVSLYWNSAPNGVTGGLIPLGAWSHIAVTLSGTTMIHYLNGATNGSGTVAGTQGADGGHAMKIGQRDDVNSVTFFKGAVAKAAVYNKVLTPTQISTHYAAR